jgi:hypothetical protein
MDVEKKRKNTIIAIGEIAKILHNNNITIVCRNRCDVLSICFVEDIEKTPENIKNTFVAELNAEEVITDVNWILRVLKGE